MNSVTTDAHILYTKSKGFTLVELLFVVILLSILGLSVMKIITQVQAAKLTAEEMRLRAENANRIFLEMRSVFSSRGTGSIQANTQNRTSANYTGGVRQVAYESVSDTNSKILRVITLGSAFATPYTPSLYGEVEARFYLEAAPEGNTQNLIFEIWATDNITQGTNTNNNQDDDISNPNASGSPLIKKTLATNVNDLRFRFRQQQEWNDDINLNFGVSPTLIEVTIELENPANQEDKEVFRTALPFGSPIR